MMVNNVRNNAQSASDECPPHYSLMDGKFEVRNLVEDRLRSLQHSTYKPNNPLIYSNYADAIEYLLRFHLKNGVQDLKKAQQVIQFMVDAYEREDSTVDFFEEYSYMTYKARDVYDMVRERGPF